ncbi:hypothetical protein DFJ74DRAFT_706220 [Hyaloraphidium curvatum]|nr:hypothetical protein DFJ74DRAFT_706220 [Hyaloraphidium curvatum]
MASYVDPGGLPAELDAPPPSLPPPLVPAPAAGASAASLLDADVPPSANALAPLPAPLGAALPVPLAPAPAARPRTPSQQPAAPPAAAVVGGAGDRPLPATPSLCPLSPQHAPFADASALYALPAADPGRDLAARVLGAPARPPGDPNRDPGDLAREGEWRACAEACARIIRSAPAGTAQDGSPLSYVPPAALMDAWRLRVLALCRMGMHRLADAEMERLGDIESDRFRVPLPAGNGTRSAVAFGLRLAAARLPALLGDTDGSIAAVAKLEWDCCKELQYLKRSDAPPPRDAEDDPATWAERILSCRTATAALLLSPTAPPGSPAPAADHAAAASVLYSVLSSPLLATIDPTGTRAKSAGTLLARVLAQAGDLRSASQLLPQLAAMAPPDPRGDAISLALLRLASDEPLAAADLLSPLARAGDPAAANALAVSYLYSQPPSLPSALAALHAVPPDVLSKEPAAVHNLATLSELADAAANRKAGVLRAVAGARALDDVALLGALKMG